MRISDWSLRLALASVAVVTLVVAAGPTFELSTARAAEISAAGPERVITYSVATRGAVLADPQQFAVHAAQTLSDPRGWSLGGSIQYVQVPEGGDFTLWLAAPETVPLFSSHCSTAWSCRVGRNVIINDLRWRTGAAWPGPLDGYQHYVINHELGHWHGLGHRSCAAPGELAPTMMQQSKGLGGCEATTWPLEDERAAVARRWDVTLRPAVAHPSPALAATPAGGAVLAAAPDGRVWWLGEAALGPEHFRAGVVGIAADGDGAGYWLATTDGNVLPFDAPDLGSIGGIALNAPIVDVAAHPDGGGYWLAASDGGVFSFGQAVFAGSMGGVALNEPIVGIAADPDGAGYWLVAADGGVFSFDADFHGSLGDLTLNAPIVAIDSGASGYRMAASNGGVFSFGTPFVGSAVGTAREYVSIANTITGGDGYWLADTTGGIDAFGAATAISAVPTPT